MLKPCGGRGFKSLHLFSKAPVAKSLWRMISQQGLWQNTMHQNYIAPRSVISWMRSNPQNFGGSLFWRAMQKHGHLIIDHLIWNLGNGTQILIGSNHILNIRQEELLLQHMVSSLDASGFRHSSGIYQSKNKDIWNNGWRST